MTLLDADALTQTLRVGRAVIGHELTTSVERRRALHDAAWNVAERAALADALLAADLADALIAAALLSALGAPPKAGLRCARSFASAGQHHRDQHARPHAASLAHLGAP